MGEKWVETKGACAVLSINVCRMWRPHFGLDLRSEYYTKTGDVDSSLKWIRLRPGDEWKTAFKTCEGLYEWLLMPFGLSNAPSTFMRIMNQLFKPFIGKVVVVDFDDMLIYSASFNEHVTHVDESKVAVVQEWPTLTTITEVQSFHAELAFQVVKEKLTTAPILILPDFSKVFELHIDSSKVAIGGVLSQGGRPVAYFSKKLTGPKSRYTTYDLEFYAVVQAVKHWRHYLFHKEFVLFIDHDSLRHIHTLDKVSQIHGRWLAFLEKFTFVVKHKTGISNRAIDALSRRSGLLVTIQVDVPGLDVIRDMMTVDPYFLVVLQGVKAGEKTRFLSA
ncbi:putative nucleotidyltransferase, ribonuclease H [Tanacetum coccineum]